jgi:hypothetical protein
MVYTRKRMWERSWLAERLILISTYRWHYWCYSHAYEQSQSLARSYGNYTIRFLLTSFLEKNTVGTFGVSANVLTKQPTIITVSIAYPYIKKQETWEKCRFHGASLVRWIHILTQYKFNLTAMSFWCLPSLAEKRNCEHFLCLILKPMNVLFLFCSTLAAFTLLSVKWLTTFWVYIFTQDLPPLLPQIPALLYLNSRNCGNGSVHGTYIE